MKSVYIVCTAIALTGLVVACSSSSSSNITTSDAFSSAGVISSPFTATSGSPVIEKSARFLPSTYTTMKTKINDMLAVSSGNVADCQALFAIDFSKVGAANANCYGPTITLNGTHPDGNGGAGAVVTNEVRPGGDLGIWDTADADGTACAAAQVNSLTNYAATIPFTAQLLASYLYCYVNNSGGTLTMPTGTGTTTLSAADLTTFGFTSGSDELTSSAASITSITDSSTPANPGYRFEITGTMKDGDLSPAKTQSYTVIVQYSKSSAGAQAGTVSYAFSDSAVTAGNCGSSGIVFAGKETFNLNAAGTTNTVMLKHAEFCTTSATPLNTTTYDIDFADKKSGPNPDGWGNNANYLLFSFDPSTLDGSYVYAWQAGMGDGNTRLFNATISTSGGTQSGTAYVGFGDDIETSASLGTIKGMICNWTGTGSAHTLQSFVQSQSISKSSGVWAATASHIQFAPIVACFKASSCSLTYDYTSATMANDHPTDTGACDKDLTALADMSFTAPSAPSF